MFDVKAKKDIFVKGLTIYPYVKTGNVTKVSVYTKTGSWDGSEEDKGTWKPVLDKEEISFAPGSYFTLTFADIQVGAGATQAFYVHMSESGALIRLMDESSKAVLAGDDGIEVLESTGMFSLFSRKFFIPQSFAGGVTWSD